MPHRPKPSASRIRRAVTADIEPLVALENATFTMDRMRARQIRRHIAKDRAIVLVAVRAGRVIGSALVFLRSNSTIARLYSIAVASDARGAGTGQRLLVAAEQHARERGARTMRLEVRSDNTAARSLYEAHGYRRIANLPGYYEDACEGWRYQRRL